MHTPCTRSTGWCGSTYIKHNIFVQYAATVRVIVLWRVEFAYDVWVRIQKLGYALYLELVRLARKVLPDLQSYQCAVDQFWKTCWGSIQDEGFHAIAVREAIVWSWMHRKQTWCWELRLAPTLQHHRHASRCQLTLVRNTLGSHCFENQSWHCWLCVHASVFFSLFENENLHVFVHFEVLIIKFSAN